MFSRFFRKPSTKTILHGLSAWTIYQIFYLLEDFAAEDQSMDVTLLKALLYYVGIPVIATVGCEDLMHKLFDIEINSELAVANTLGAVIGYCIIDNVALDISIPMSLYGYAVSYHFFSKDDPETKLEELAPFREPITEARPDDVKQRLRHRD